MRILLLGEFSALHNNLKDGLLELGHEVVIAANGDGFKKIPSDISFESLLPGKLGRLERGLRPLMNLQKLMGYDVAQLINPFVFYHDNKFPYSVFLAQYFFNKIIDGSAKFFILAAGDDAYFWRYGRKELDYGPFDDFLKYDHKSTTHFFESDKSLSFNKMLVDQSNGVIPVMYEYEVSYRSSNKMLSTIPLPINTKKIEYRDNIPRGKLVIFHGLNRYGFKGTRHVEEAFKILGNKFPNDLELIIDGNMPLDQYLLLMRRTNVVIDQLNSYSLGMNGVYALAMGKVVLGGAEPQSLKSIGVHSSPVINLKPSAKSIVDAVENLLANCNELQKLGAESRKFAEAVHGHTHIAQRYIDTWTSH